MSSDEVNQIQVGQHRMGIIGLKVTLAEMAETLAGQSDEQIRCELLKRLAKRNYIPASAIEDYGRAFLREYKKLIGAPVAEEDSGLLEVKILGPGCPCCDQLERDVMAAMAETQLAVDFEHVTDIAEIGSYGVMGTPALVVDKKVVAVGTAPPKAKIKTWLQQAATKQ
jgi:small redox-active disulfide protein 2